MKTVTFLLALTMALGIARGAQAAPRQTPREAYAAHGAAFEAVVADIERCHGPIAFYANYREATRCADGDLTRSKAISRRLTDLGVRWALAARTRDGSGLKEVQLVLSSEGLMLGGGSASVLVYLSAGGTPRAEDVPLDKAGHWFARETRD